MNPNQPVPLILHLGEPHEEDLHLALLNPEQRTLQLAGPALKLESEPTIPWSNGSQVILLDDQKRLVRYDFATDTSHVLFDVDAL